MRVSGLHLATSADVGADASRVVGYGAFAFEYSASARLAEADRELLLSACMAALGEAARNGGKPPAPSVNAEVARAFVVAGDLRHAVRERPAARLHRLARAETAADRGCDRQHGAGGLRRSALPASERERSRRAASRRLDPLASASRSQPTAKSMLAGALEPDRDGLVLGVGRRRALFLPSVWRQLPDARAFVRHLIAKAGLETTALAGGVGGEALPRRIIRRSVAIGRSGRDRASGEARTREARVRVVCTESGTSAQKKLVRCSALRRRDVLPSLMPQCQSSVWNQTTIATLIPRRNWGAHKAQEPVMCDYSLEMYGSRPAREGEIVHDDAFP